MEHVAPPLILVVEDDPLIGDLLCDVLEEHSYRCVTVSSADSALTALETLRPALITLDLGLPGVSGRTLLLLLRANAQTRDIPVIIISAERVIEHHLRAASQAVLAKPFDIDQLVVTIQRALRQDDVPPRAREFGAVSPPQQPPHARPHPARHPHSGGGEASAGASD
jgi:DNA-binding response OmpR family regulator